MNDLDQDDVVERMVSQLEGILKPHQRRADLARRAELSPDAPAPEQPRDDDSPPVVEAADQYQAAVASHNRGAPEDSGAIEAPQPSVGRPPREPQQRYSVRDLLLIDAGVDASPTDGAEHESGAVAATDSAGPDWTTTDATAVDEERLSSEARASVVDGAASETPASVLDATGATALPPGAEKIESVGDIAPDPEPAPVDAPAPEPEIATEEASLAPPQVEPAAPAEGAQMPRRLSTRLGRLLVDSGRLSDEQLRTALQCQHETGERLGEVLVKNGYIEEPALLSVLEEQYGVPAVSLEDVELDDRLAELIPSDMANRYLLVPLALHAETVDVAMVDPSDFVAMAHVRFATGLRPNVFITTATAARRAIATLYDGEAGDTTARPPDPREAVRRMIRDRDGMFIAADRDARKFYELAASIDAFVDEIFRKVTGPG